jgi:hypothetical protein
MALRDIIPGADALADDIQQLIDDAKGNGGQPKSYVGLNDPDNYVIVLKNLDAEGSKALLVLSAIGNAVLLQVNREGVRVNPTGIGGADGVPVTTDAVQTLSNKTFSGLAQFNRVKGMVGSDIASTGTITVLGLAVMGNIHTITGTALITSIVATADLAGQEITFRFASFGCRVANGGNLRLRGGDYLSVIDGTLTLYCDGTNWIEKNRTPGPGNIGFTGFRTTPVGVSHTVAKVLFLQSFENVIGMTTPPADDEFYLPLVGRWRIFGKITWAPENAQRWLRAWITVNGVEQAYLHSMRFPQNADHETTIPFDTEIVITNPAHKVELWLYISNENGTAINVQGGRTFTSVTFRYMGA